MLTEPSALHLDRLDAGVIVALTASVLLATAYSLAAGQQLIALGLAVLATICVTAIARPRAYRILALAAIFAIPIVRAIPALRPLDYDYFVYVAAFTLLLVVLGMFQPSPIPARLGTAFLGYVVLSATIATVTALGPADAIRALPSVLAAFGVYVLILRSDRTERRFVLGALLLFASVESVIAILQVFTGWPVFSVVLPTLFEENRNYLAYFIPGMGLPSPWAPAPSTRSTFWAASSRWPLR